MVLVVLVVLYVTGRANDLVGAKSRGSALVDRAGLGSRGG